MGRFHLSYGVTQCSQIDDSCRGGCTGVRFFFFLSFTSLQPNQLRDLNSKDVIHLEEAYSGSDVIPPVRGAFVILSF